MIEQLNLKLIQLLKQIIIDYHYFIKKVRITNIHLKIKRSIENLKMFNKNINTMIKEIKEIKKNILLLLKNKEQLILNLKMMNNHFKSILIILITTWGPNCIIIFINIMFHKKKHKVINHIQKMTMVAMEMMGMENRRKFPFFNRWRISMNTMCLVSLGQLFGVKFKTR